jgi:hypothetical protein
MLQVSALFVAGAATLDEDGAIRATRIPTTWYRVGQIPLWGEVPVVVVVHASAGGDYDPELHIVCKDPGGVPRGTLQAKWHWPDEDDRPSKYRCLTQGLKFPIETEGEYTIGAYFDAEGNIEMATPMPISIELAEENPAGSGGDGTT